MKIYIDSECKCHLTNDGTMFEIEAPEKFDGKCPTYIEGFRVRPEGFAYTREDGRIFGPTGESITPWRDIALLEEFQAQSEESQQTINEYEAAFVEIEKALGVYSE